MESTSRTTATVYGGGQVSVEFDGPTVAVVCLDRAPHNFISEADVVAIGHALDDAASAGARCILLRSVGKNFCAGATLESKVGGGVDFGMYEHIPKLFEQPVPIVAAVQGRAVGAGLGLALVADFRVATAHSTFVAPFTTLGFHHGFGLTATLPAVVGRQHALELLLAGSGIDGTRAYEIGLVDVMATASGLDETALSYARTIAGAAPLAVRAARQTLRGDVAAKVREALVVEQRAQESLMQTADFVEGVQAARERRAPRFGGT